MAAWARRRGNFLDQWHLPTPDQPKGPQRGALMACGENLGESELDWDHDDSIVGNRCPACQGIALRSVSRS